MKTNYVLIDYEFAFEREIASMTVAEFMRWNPRFDEADALARIAKAKAKVDRQVAQFGEKLLADLDAQTDSQQSQRLPPDRDCCGAAAQATPKP